MLPHDLLPKSTVYDYFAQWRDDGTWAKIVGLLRTRVRVQEGREPTPRAACIDSQSVKTTEVGGPERGYDGGKKISGRKRHVLVDTIGLLLVVLITSAALDDGAAAIKLLTQISAEDFPRLTVIFGDSKYHNHDLEAWLQEVPSRLAILMRDLQFVLTELAPKSAFPPSRQDQLRLASIKERQMEAYDRWRQSHGDIAKPSETVEWNRATQDEIAD